MDSITIDKKLDVGTMVQSRSDVDWDAVEREYRAGQLSLREIGRLCSVSHTAIAKRAKKEGWTQNLAASVRAQVTTRLVSSEVATENAERAVDEAANRAIALVREHRRDIGAARRLVAALISELQDASDNINEVLTAIEAETDTDHRRRMLKAISLPGRASVIASLSVALKNLVGLERRKPPVEAALKVGRACGSVC